MGFDVFSIGVLVEVLFVALVGGNWNNSSRAGLWYWNFNETSSNTWTNIGARLLNLIWDLVCVSSVLLRVFSCRR